jgi:hypothetical protein
MKLYCQLPGNPNPGHVYQCSQCSRLWLYRRVDGRYCVFEPIGRLRALVLHHRDVKLLDRERLAQCESGFRDE